MIHYGTVPVYQSADETALTTGRVMQYLRLRVHLFQSTTEMCSWSERITKLFLRSSNHQAIKDRNADAMCEWSADSILFASSDAFDEYWKVHPKYILSCEHLSTNEKIKYENSHHLLLPSGEILELGTVLLRHGPSSIYGLLSSILSVPGIRFISVLLPFAKLLCSVFLLNGGQMWIHIKAVHRKNMTTCRWLGTW